MNQIKYESAMRKLIAIYLSGLLPDYLQKDLKSLLCACSVFEQRQRDTKGKALLEECLVKLQTTCKEAEAKETMKEEIDNLYRW